MNIKNVLERFRGKEVQIILTIIIFILVVQLAKIQEQNAELNKTAYDAYINKDRGSEDLLKKYHCTYEELIPADNSSFRGCLSDTVTQLEKEQEKVFRVLVGRLEFYSQPNTDIIFYSTEKASEDLKSWYKKVNDYTETRCRLEANTVETVSGWDSILNLCKIKILDENIQLLNSRVSFLKSHSTIIRKLNTDL